ncbi:putative manganese-dependent inorganic diphosphatase [Deferribacter autotrophicus]|uniref:inorganic diphosphatase n=1 Tax=Deferribacter autotrophicus TaxID=500465 RepID=A0A5A8F5E0_9BACT|nr:putative manganese-dependent inorganic diphosphatase [Deferribacter autotrophicus]KAA0258604.1 putative manganese-dependent inorganic diphosphatase [Deferribacter autotrophicus]
MEKVYVIGHKNPDTDSICSAYCYANLKNQIDKQFKYIAARCGNLNKQTKYIFEKLNIEPPIFLKDVYPKVSDVMTKNVIYSLENDPIYNVMMNINKLKIRLTPVLDNNRKLSGIVSILEMTDYYMGEEDIDKRPSYLLRCENIKQIVKGETIQDGDKDEFLSYLIVGAMPFDRFKERFDKMDLDKITLIVGRRVDIIEYAAEKGVPAIIVTGLKSKDEMAGIDLGDYKGFVYMSYHDTAETLRRLLMSVPAKFVMSREFPVLSSDTYLEEAKDVLINENRRGLPVVDSEKRLIGIITRSDMLKKYKNKLILMDHNELEQAIDGAETADILEIIDHHRLGTIKTNTPIFFYAKPLGSTCTLVYELYKHYGIKIDENIAVLLLSGILSDTVILKSPTTTKWDIDAANNLAQIAGLDISSYGQEIFSVAESLKTRDFKEVINADFKVYNEFGVKFGIGQVEVVTLEDYKEVYRDLLNELEKTKNDKRLDWAMLLVTDIVSENSYLLSTGFEPVEKLMIYRKIIDNTFYLPKVLSRKKQLLPELLRALEEYHLSMKK